MNSRIQTGLVLGLFGAALDFASGFLFLSQSMTNDMGMLVSQYNQRAIEWSVVLFSLGFLLIVTSLLSVSSFGMKRMRILGGLMTVYGGAMFVIGSLMYSGLTPIMTGELLSSAGMFVVGALMIINGALMMSKQSQEMMPRMETGENNQAGQRQLVLVC